MRWCEAREVYPNKWLLFEALEAYSADGLPFCKVILIHKDKTMLLDNAY